MFNVVSGVFSHDINHARVRLLCVVQVGEAIGEAGAKVQKRGGGLTCHPVVAVCGAGQHTFEKTQNAAHAGHLVQSGHEMHFGRAWICEADVDAAGQQGAHQAFRTVHV